MPKFLRNKPRTVRDVLVGLGLTDDEIAEAEAAGTDELLAIDGVVLPVRSKWTIEDLATKVGTDVETVRLFWRALGFVEPDVSDRTFNKRDVAILKALI